MRSEENSDGSWVSYVNGDEIDDHLLQRRKSPGSQVIYEYYLSNHQGSISQMTDENGNVISGNTYDTFGNRTGTIASRFGYTGREHDPDTGLMYYRARWYDSASGRFISEDPIGFEGGINLYGYVDNDPINLVDPDGLQKKRRGNAVPKSAKLSESAKRRLQIAMDEVGKILDSNQACRDALSNWNAVEYDKDGKAVPYRYRAANDAFNFLRGNYMTGDYSFAMKADMILDSRSNSLNGTPLGFFIDWKFATDPFPVSYATSDDLLLALEAILLHETAHFTHAYIHGKWSQLIKGSKDIDDAGLTNLVRQKCLGGK